MTVPFFNNKYKAFLDKDGQGLAIDIPPVIKYLDNKFQELILYPDFRFYQIKLRSKMSSFQTNLPRNVRTGIEAEILRLSEEYFNTMYGETNMV